MQLIYLAGAYRANKIVDLLQNIRLAEQGAMQIWQAGDACLSPHMNSAFFDHLCPDINFIDGTMLMLSRCDRMVLLPNYESSVGTQGEIEYAKRKDIPIETLEEYLCRKCADALAGKEGV